MVHPFRKQVDEAQKGLESGFKACRDGNEDVHKATLTYESCVFAAFGVMGLLGQVVGAAVAGAVRTV